LEEKEDARRAAEEAFRPVTPWGFGRAARWMPIGSTRGRDGIGSCGVAFIMLGVLDLVLDGDPFACRRSILVCALA
jgi:hypothetical protein